MNTPNVAERTRRAPHGCSTSLRITLAPAERERIEALANREHRTLGNTARLLLLRGFESLEHNAHLVE